MEPGALNVLNKCLTTELCSEFFVVFIVWGVGFVFETESHSVAQAVLELILLPSDFQCWDYRHAPPHSNESES
jgi:hypothetical protein